MKQIVTFLIFSFTLFAQSISQLGVSPNLLSGTDSLFNANPYGAGRGANVADLDGDMKKEVWITSYTNGGRVYCFEETGDGSMAFVWASPELDSTDYGSTPRDLAFGDMDGDGNHEVIFHIGRFNGTTATQDNGLYIYENTGDNMFDNVFHANFTSALNDSLYESRVEGFSVDDIDGDGKHEILLASNGQSNPVFGTKDGSTPYSEDRYIVMGMTGSITGGALQDAALTTEFAVAPRDVDKDGARENALGGGSPQDIIVADIDGDGLHEAHCLAWNNAAYFNFEATGADAYTIGDTNYVKLGESDDWTLGMAAADVDGDGKHEVYISGYYDKKVWVIKDADGDAGSLDTTGSSLKTFAGNTEIGIMATNTGQTGVAAGSFGLAMGGAPGSDLHHWAYGTGSVLDSANWTHAAFSVEDSATGFVPKIASVDWDGDTNPDFLLAYQGVSNSKAFHADSASWSRVFRIVEVDMTTAAVEDLAVITPEDYKLNQNYPNPFNPTTNIEFTLPVANNISLKIYNMVGQEIISLISQSMMDAGSHSVMWNGLDKNGVQVSSGTYIYKLEYGNMSKVRQMTFMK